MSEQAAPAPGEQVTTLDHDAVERDLADVERALQRLDDGTYWTDEATGEALDEELLARRPTARRAETD